MAQRPHASSVSIGKRKPKIDSKGRDRKRTYSIGDSDRVDLLCSPPRVQWWAPLEKLMEDRRQVLERNNIIIRCSFHFYHFYSDERFSRLLH